MTTATWRFDRDRLRATPQGLTVGMAMATGIWLWIALVDLLVGEPFQTFAVLGGVAAFTAVHFVLNVAYGVTLVSLVRSAKESPSLIIGLIFTFIIFEVAFGMATVLLSNTTVGHGAWIRLLGGNVVGIAIAAAMLYRSYPLADLLHRAEQER